ncbi:NXPE family member 3-like [Cyprinodon tularosa]|uniref:NXPE family member 3-like n=1 Tax=Cyprinodon tularosa TaxID=77115 RepID=UPI0018E229AC|nr:NXPE family member 3-like [Cyprinodon tularosa]
MGGQYCRKHYCLAVVFTSLTLCVLCFLIYNENIMNERSSKLVENKTFFAKPQVQSPEHPLPSDVCSFHSLSPEDALEWNHMKDSVAWPETPPLPTNFSIHDTSDPAHSTFTILPGNRGGSWHVGDQLEVLVKINDFYGHPKKFGGDFLLARLHNPTLFAGVAGQVLDHQNGSYTAVFPLLWEGSAEVQVILVHPSEAITVLERVTQEQPDRVYFKSIFRSGSVTQTTTCNVCLKAAQQNLCNYTDVRTGEPWFCYKPKKLGCDTRITHAEGGFKQPLKPGEGNLFKRGVNMKVSIRASGISNIDILPKVKGDASPSLNIRPAGYYYQGVWRVIQGTPVKQFNTSTAISQCLKGKVLHLYGDSTIRQWFEYLIESVPGLKKFDLKTLKQSGPFLALDYANNILLTFRCHGPPIRFGTMAASQTRYVANELDSVIGGTGTAVVIGIWTHLSTFPFEVYVRRLLNVRRAVERLLIRAPGTLVIIRTANPKALDLLKTLTDSDWYSLQRDKILRAIFKGVQVQLVDAWEMTIAHYLPHNLHPEPPIIKNMINIILTHLCPPGESFNDATKP